MTFCCLLQARHDLWGPKSVNDTTMSCMKQAMCIPRMGNGSPIGIVIISQREGAHYGLSIQDLKSKV